MIALLVSARLVAGALRTLPGKALGLLLGMVGQGVPAVASESALSMNGMLFTTFEQSMSGTSHDFSGMIPGGSSVDACGVCHLFEDGPTGPIVSLVGASYDSAVYVTYQSASLRSTAAQPDGVSRFCLSCHDGTIAEDVHGLSPGAVSGDASLGTDLSDDHPVSIRYDDADRGLRSVSTPIFFGDGSAGTIADLLEDGAVQCSSCHDVHNVRAAPSTDLLTMSNRGSALCMSCHAM
jgi:predicted CXXCH cytochrome family protein